MTTTSENGLRQLGEGASRLAVITARDEHVLRRVEGSNREGDWLCSCGVGFPVPGDARDRANIEHSAHFWETVRETCAAQGVTLSTAWMMGPKVAEQALADARANDEPIVAADPITYATVALRRLLKASQRKVDRLKADSPNDHRGHEINMARVRALKLAVSVVEGSRKAVAASPTGADFLVVDGGPGMPKRTFMEVGSDIAAMTDRQLSNVLHGRDKDDNGEFTASSMGAAQEKLASVQNASVTAQMGAGPSSPPLAQLLKDHPDFRMVDVNLLKAILDLLETGTCARPNVGIELQHLINERPTS